MAESGEGTIVALILLALLCPPVPPVEPLPVTRRMIAARYDPGVMEGVAIYRGLAWTGCGMAYDGPPLGTMVRVEGVRTGVARTCQVVDVSETIDLARHVKARQVELDDRAARAVCGRRYYRSRPRECPVRVTVLRLP